MGLKELASLKNLTSLEMSGVPVTDAGLKHLTGLKKLKNLGLFGCRQVTDAGVKELTKLETLTDLNLGATGLTDVGMKHLTALKNLTFLYKDHTIVTPAGIAEGLAPHLVLRVFSPWVFGSWIFGSWI